MDLRHVGDSGIVYTISITPKGNEWSCTLQAITSSGDYKTNLSKKVKHQSRMHLVEACLIRIDEIEAVFKEVGREPEQVYESESKSTG